MKPAVTIVILNWNGKHWLETFLPSVTATTYQPHEVLVVDNGSTDDSIAFLQEAYPQVRLLAFDRNHGFTDGHNLALPHIHTPYVALLNSDVEVSPDWLQPLVDLMEATPDLASVQPKILAYHDKQSFEYAGASGGFIDALGYPFCRGRLFDSLEQDQGQYDQPMETFWATGACSLIRREVVDHIGLFEPSYFAHMEEIDFCWRAKNHGYRIMVQPRSHVYHVGGGALPQGNPRKTYLNVRNSLATLYKNLPEKGRFRRLLARLLLDGLWALQCLSKGELGTIAAIAKGHWHFFGKWRFWARRRAAIYPHNPPKQLEEGVYRGSIVWAYFLRGKKTWAELMGAPERGAAR